MFPSPSAANQQGPERLIAEDNINSRYTVESIEFPEEEQPKLTSTLKQRVAALVGARFDPAQFDELASQIRKELHLRSVQPHVLRGSSPRTVRVYLETERRSVEFDVSVPKFLFHANQGWSALAQASTTIARAHLLRGGVVSDGDELTERFTGFNASYQNLHPGTDRLRAALLVEGLHEQWSTATLRADGVQQADLYRARRNLQPEVIVLLSRSLVLTLGVSFETLEMESPGLRTRNADAILAALQYSKQFEAGAGERRELTANYSLRSASPALLGDFGYTRHRAAVGYTVVLGRNTIGDQVLAGTISGKAPLFERFVLGTSSLLRGWDRYQIDPLGGERVAHNALDYSYRIDPGSVQLFYDAGILWNQGQSAPLRHSVGVGYRQSVFSLALAFPIRGGRITPVFMLGMNY